MFCGVRQGWRGFVMWLVAVLAVGFCGACGQKYNNNQSVGPMDEPDVQEPEPDVSVEPDVGPDDVGDDGEDEVEDEGPCGGVDQEVNACGGCSVLPGEVGASCGSCGLGTFECSGTDELSCEGDLQNVCGGCEALEFEPGQLCGQCNAGHWECDGAQLVCVDEPGPAGLNGCGGCQIFAEGEPGGPCGTCDSGTLMCTGPESVECAGDRGEGALNSCGGCRPFEGAPGLSCGSCGSGILECNGRNGLRCENEAPCGYLEPCAGDSNCVEGLHCSQGRCAPEGLAFIPAGEFIMGSPEDEVGRVRTEIQHHVTLTRPFLMQQTEVTQGMWEEYGGRFRPFAYPECGDECPAESINWYEALHYANRISREEGLEECYALYDCGQNFLSEPMDCRLVEFVGLDCEGYRLPTEAEWEYAARAGTTGPTYAGTFDSCDDEGLHEIAWVCDFEGSPHPVGQLMPNPWGLYDVLGNISEMTWDWGFDWSDEPVTDPIAPIGQTKITRGFPFSVSNPNRFRVAAKGTTRPHNIGYSIGFRLVRTISIP